MDKANKPSAAVPSTGDRIRYYVDLFMSSSPSSRFLGLFVVSATIVGVCATLALLVSPSDGESALPMDAHAPSLGPAGAPVTLLLFGDLECPHTRRMLSWRISPISPRRCG